MRLGPESIIKILKEATQLLHKYPKIELVTPLLGFVVRFMIVLENPFFVSIDSIRFETGF